MYLDDYLKQRHRMEAGVYLIRLEGVVVYVGETRRSVKERLRDFRRAALNTNPNKTMYHSGGVTFNKLGLDYFKARVTVFPMPNKTQAQRLAIKRKELEVLIRLAETTGLPLCNKPV